MKITITIEEDGKIVHRNVYGNNETLEDAVDNEIARRIDAGLLIVTDINPDDLPLGEEVPDEKNPPEHVFSEVAEQKGVESVFPTDLPTDLPADFMLKPETKEDPFAGIKIFRHTDKYLAEHDAKIKARNEGGYKQKKNKSAAEKTSADGDKKKRGPRGPYKKHNIPAVLDKKESLQLPVALVNRFATQKDNRGRKPNPVVTPNPKYLSMSTIEALEQGKKINLPGVQATKNKFIVGGAYIRGRLDNARELYNTYFHEQKSKKEDFTILTWESWLAIVYAADQKDDRKIDVE